jgi:hypothetical protein
VTLKLFMAFLPLAHIPKKHPLGPRPDG